MNRRQKSLQHRFKDPPYRQAFERLEKALAENTRSNDIEKIDRLRLTLFGCAPGTVEFSK